MNEITEKITEVEIAENIPVGLIVFNEKFEITFANKNIFHFYLSVLQNYDNIIGLNIIKNNLFDNKKLNTKILQLKDDLSFEYHLSRKTFSNQVAIYTSLKGSAIFSKKIFKGGIIVIEDIKIESIPVYKNHQTGILLPKLNTNFAIINTKGKILYSSPINFGIEKKEKFRAGNNINTIFSSNIANKIFSEIEKLISEKEDSEIIIEHNYKNVLSYLRITLISTNFESNDDEIVLLFKDITKDYLKEISRIEELSLLKKYETIVSKILDAIINLDKNGKIIYWSKSAEELFGYSSKYTSGIFIGEIIKGFTPEFLKNVTSKISKEKKWREEIKFVTKPDREKWIAVKFVYDKEKNLVLLCSDISEKKKEELEIIASESRFRRLTTNSFQYICTISSKGKFQFANPIFSEKFGFEKEELAELNFENLLDGDFKSENPFLIEELLTGKIKSVKLILNTKKRKTVYVIGSFSPVYSSAEKIEYIDIILADITSEVLSNEAIKKSEELYKNVTENIDAFIWTSEYIDGKLEQVFYSPVIENMTGYKADEFIKQKSLWLRTIHPDDRKGVIKSLKKMFNDTSANAKEIPYRIIKKDKDIIWVKNKLNIKRNNENKIIKIFGLVSDITASKRIEEKLKNSTKTLQETNETKDRFISIISHDLRSPFNSILGFTDLLMESDLSHEKQQQYLSFISESSKNMLALVNSLLDWTRLQTGRIKFDPQRINGTLIVERAIQMISGVAIKKNISLHSEIVEDYFIHADEDLLLQALNNLISNAVKFTKAKDEIIVETKKLPEENSILFSVKDTGIGISPDNIEKLFKVDVKFTTRGTSGEAGSGLGLSLVKDIIEKHGGRIWVESKVNSGTTFFFTIPISSTNILLVDSKKTDRILYAKIIKSFFPNYTILTADTGEEAFNIINQAQPILVITNHLLPKMTGLEFSKKIVFSEQNYKPRIIILSDRLDDNLNSEYKNIGIENTFSKPVNLNSFKKAIEKSLHEPIYSN